MFFGKPHITIATISGHQRKRRALGLFKRQVNFFFRVFKGGAELMSWVGTVQPPRLSIFFTLAVPTFNSLELISSSDSTLVMVTS